MENSSNIIQLLGFVLVLGGITLILVRTMYALAKGRMRRIRIGFEILFILSIIYWFTRPALSFVGLESGLEQATNVISFLWVISLAFLVNAIMNRFLWRGILSDHGDRRIPKLITDGLGLLVYAIALMIVLHYVYDEPIGAVLATSGAAAVVIGFGAQSTIREVFSGVALNATQALRVGDYVEIDGIYGRVYDINWRSVSIQNPHTDSLYIFPNSAVAERTILNFCEPTEKFRYFINFSVELSAPPALVIQSIAKELENSRFVFRDPKPDFNLLGYSERGVDYRIRYHFDGDDPWWDAQNEVVMAIWSAMRKQNLRISMNRMLQSSPDEWPLIDERVQSKTQVEDVRAAVKRHPILGKLSDEEIEVLCKSYRSVDLGPPSCFFERGNTCAGLFLMIEGEVGIFDCNDNGDELKIESCEPGDLFGVSPAVGAYAHRFSAQSCQYSIAICFPRENLEKLLSANSQLALDLTVLVDQQNVERKVAKEAALKTLLLEQHHRQRRSVTDQLRRGMGEMLQKPKLHHLLDHISKSVRNEELAEGVTAGAAMIATARGLPDEAEREHLQQVLRDTDLLRHLDVKHCMSLFDKYTDMLVDESPTGREKVLKGLMEAKRVKNGPDIVLKICNGLCGVHEVPTDQELIELKNIGDALAGSS